MKLLRGHGLGNDYLILVDGPSITPELARAVCDRHTGVGSDGLLEPAIPVGTDYGVRIWNPDGSIAEKSGNGLRIFARWLHALRGAPDRFTIWTGHDAVSCICSPEHIRIDMGRVRAEAGSIDLAGKPFAVVFVNVGNPHCVHFPETTDLDGLPWRGWGAAIEKHPHFPNHTNVQFARVLGPHDLEARIWERGAGETQASGSSACAVVAAAVETGRIAPGTARVHMPGGTLDIHVENGRVALRGPAELVGEFTVFESYYPSLGIGSDSATSNETRKPT
ncbi:MAG: diaminopimelate epimerase [Myxococcota bacterium]